MTDDDRQPVILDAGAPADHLYVQEVADAFAESVRVLNHQTLHHEAIMFPSEADGLIREIASGVSRLPQLFAQIGAWLDQEQAAGRIEVPCGEFAGSSATAVSTARVRLDMASAIAAALHEALGDAASVTCDLAAADTGEGGSDD